MLFYQLFICFFVFNLVDSGIVFKSKNSSLTLTGTTSKIALQTTLTGFNGRLKLPDANSLRLTAGTPGSRLIFADGAVNFGQGDAVFTGTFTPESGTNLILDSSSEVSGRGTVLAKPITVGAGNTATLSGHTVLSGTTTLASSTSQLIVKVANKLDQSIALNLGKVTLAQDLKFADGVGFTGTGTVDLANNILYLPSGITQTGTLTYLNANDIQFTGPQTLNGGVALFSGAGLTSLVNGNGYTWTLASSGKIQVGANHKLYLNDVRIKGLGPIGSQGYFDLDPTSTLVLSNVVLDLAGNYTHGAGTISVEGEACKIINHGFVFTVQDSNTRLIVNDVSFVYDALSLSDASPFVFANPAQHRQLVGVGQILSASLMPSTMQIANSSTTMLYDLQLSAESNLQFYNATPGTPKAMTLDGNNLSIKFPNSSGSFFNLDANVQLTLQNLVLEDFNPAAINYGAGSSTITFGDGVVIKLPKDLTILSTDRAWVFNGNATINGQNNALTINDDDLVTITGAKTLMFTNMTLKPQKSASIKNLTTTATLAFKNVNFKISTQGQDFTTGNLDFYDNVALFADTPPLAQTLALAKINALAVGMTIPAISLSATAVGLRFFQVVEGGQSTVMGQAGVTRIVYGSVPGLSVTSDIYSINNLTTPLVSLLLARNTFGLSVDIGSEYYLVAETDTAGNWGVNSNLGFFIPAGTGLSNINPVVAGTVANPRAYVAQSGSATIYYVSNLNSALAYPANTTIVTEAADSKSTAHHQIAGGTDNCLWWITAGGAIKKMIGGPGNTVTIFDSGVGKSWNYIHNIGSSTFGYFLAVDEVGGYLYYSKNGGPLTYTGISNVGTAFISEAGSLSVIFTDGTVAYKIAELESYLPFTNFSSPINFSSTGNLTIKSGATLTCGAYANLRYLANPSGDGTNTAATKRHFLMEDSTSTLKLIGSTLTGTDTGLALTQGNLLIDGDSTIISSTTNAAALEIASAVNVQIKDNATANFYGPVLYG